MAARNFAPISIEDLMKKIGPYSGSYNYHELINNAIASDIKVSFDLENVASSASEFGPKPLMGYHTEANGLTYLGMCAGGDWEHPVFFMIYWDGKKLRGYVPTEGNPWNTTSKCAYGNDEEADLKNAKKRWPDKFAESEEVSSDDFDFDPALIRNDIMNRILPPGQKVESKVPERKVPKVVPKVKKGVIGNEVKTLQERIESLTFYGTGDEAYELFSATCLLCYNMFGLGSLGKAEILCAWAEEMAYESRAYDSNQNDHAQGQWG